MQYACSEVLDAILEERVDMNAHLGYSVLFVGFPKTVQPSWSVPNIVKA